MLELLNQLDGFEARGDVKVILATNRIESLDPALIRPGRIDRKIQLPSPDTKTKRKIFQVRFFFWHSISVRLALGPAYMRLMTDVSGLPLRDPY